MHMYIILTITSCNATSDVLEQEECITKLIMQAVLIFWYKYKKRTDFNYSLVVESVWWKIVFEDNIQWNLIGYLCT